MKNIIICMYITLIPLIFTGIFNMVFCKLKVCMKLSKPMDFGKSLKDGKRIFGDNKTFKGFIGYMVISIVCTVLWGILCDNVAYLQKHNFLYVNYDNTLVYNIIMGLLIGLAYAMFELPNSFIKRRLGIESGNTLNTNNVLKYIFAIVDQCDSLIGCVLVIWLVYPLGLANYILYVFLGLVTHLAVNMILFIFKLRKTIF